MVRYCSVYGCLETDYSNKSRKFYRFPADEKKCKYWVKATGRADLEQKDLKTLYTSYFVCELHFADSDRTTRVLKKNAVPTLLLPQLEDPSGTSKYTQTDISLLCSCCKIQTINIQTTSHTSQTTMTSSNKPQKKKSQPKLKPDSKKRKLLNSRTENTKQTDNRMSPVLENNIDTKRIKTEVSEDKNNQE